ncbi:hypothetical protein EPJ79_08635 [Brachyspira aalborgi]|uniref:G domain-containing protein n=1 Tax=Brachyspira aalborgi TaxID=29522 RepID=A0A5C8D6V0_9SPIR|nr:hypothetical protein [Brachyspira aalborgi]TXJ21179.1 hypothetical protein EPJ79_08635 [Brachyspira aalborgi]
MPFPLIPVIIVASSVLVGGTIIGTIVYNIGRAKVKVKPANYKDKADVTILFIGETEAGKDTVIELIKTRKFLEKHEKTPAFNTIAATISYKSNTIAIGNATTDINYKDKIKIKIINTSGSEHSLEDTEKAKKLSHDIRCYIFDARDFYNVENIKFGIQNTIDECKEKGIKYMSLGTRGDEVDKEKIENEVRSMGMKCSIFELKKEPVEQVIEFLFKEYL